MPSMHSLLRLLLLRVRSVLSHKLLIVEYLTAAKTIAKENLVLSSDVRLSALEIAPRMAQLAHKILG